MVWRSSHHVRTIPPYINRWADTDNKRKSNGNEFALKLWGGDKDNTLF